MSKDQGGAPPPQPPDQTKPDPQKTSLALRKKDLHGMLARMAPEITKVAGRYLDADTLAGLVYTEAARTPDILLCVENNPGSVASTVMMAARLGLDVSSPLGHFYLIPRNMGKGVGWTLTYIIGYKGLLELCRRSGSIIRPNAGVVYRGELPTNGGRFHWKDEPPECDHPRDWDLVKRDADVVAAYAVVILAGQERVQVLLDRPTLDDRRGRAMSDKFWARDYPAMCRKTALRALLNGGLVPLSPELAEALKAEDDLEQVQVIQAAPSKAPTGRQVNDPLRARLQLEDPIPADKAAGADRDDDKPPPHEGPPPADKAAPDKPSKKGKGGGKDTPPPKTETVLEAILRLESELDSKSMQAAGEAAGLNPEAELEGQADKLDRYLELLKAAVAASRGDG